MRILLALLTVVFVPMAVADEQSAHLKQAQEAFLCGETFKQYGAMEQYHYTLAEAGDDLINLAHRYAVANGASESGVTHMKEAATIEAINFVVQNEYMPPDVETHCIMIYRAVDTIMNVDTQ